MKYLETRIKLFGIVMSLLVGILYLLALGPDLPSMWGKAVAGLLLVIGGGTVYLAYLYIYKPYREEQKIEILFSAGVVYSDVFHMPSYISKVDEMVMKRFSEMLDTQKLINVSKKEAEYLALQNQINPHFLYNTLEGIRSEALMVGADSIAEMTEALATFFRYTISQTGNLVSLEKELENIENYYYIQQFRFGDKLELSIEYDSDEDMDESEILDFKLPKLTLQPIVENAIYHGIENKIGKGYLNLRIRATREHLIIRVSDDGMGIDEEQLVELNRQLKSLSIDAANDRKKGGIAIQNVNNRIKLLFGEQYGICIYSQKNVGTDVEITLPVVIGNEPEGQV